MTSRVRLRSSRANGALSRGPVTAAGKLRAAGNSCKHGLYSKRVVLKTESQDEFDALLLRYTADLKPRTDAESAAVRQIVSATWCLRRLLNIERQILEEALVTVTPTPHDPYIAITEAWILAAQKPVFRQISRVEDRYSRQFSIAVAAFRTARLQRTAENQHPNLLNEIFINEQAPDLATVSGNRAAAPAAQPPASILRKDAASLPAVAPERSVIATLQTMRDRSHPSPMGSSTRPVRRALLCRGRRTPAHSPSPHL